MIVRERPLGAFELVGPHDVAVGLTPEQVKRLSALPDPTRLSEAIERDAELEPIAAAFRYFLREEANQAEALRELKRSLAGRQA
jgi:GrpB-like predicted nucleotidyltransferase (UPF0157 family)